MNTKITEKDMLAQFKDGGFLLPPLVILQLQLGGLHKALRADAIIEAGLPGGGIKHRFVIEAKAQSTLESIHTAHYQAKSFCLPGQIPLVLVPFLSPERIQLLEEEKINGIDLCGNGVIQIKDVLYVVRTGKPNAYPQSRSLNNPYRGRSSLVARALLTKRTWPSLTSLREWIENNGASLSIGQASKAVAALKEDLMITSQKGSIQLKEPARLLDKLGSEWRKPQFRNKKSFRVKGDVLQNVTMLDFHPTMKWCVTGESSTSKYTPFSQGGPLKIAVTDIFLAGALIGGAPETVPSFADLELLETVESGYYFQCFVDGSKIKWASKLQTWLELQSGDARQKEAAQDIRLQILHGVSE